MERQTDNAEIFTRRCTSEKLKNNNHLTEKLEFHLLLSGFLILTFFRYYFLNLCYVIIVLETILFIY